LVKDEGICRNSLLDLSCPHSQSDKDFINLPLNLKNMLTQINPKLPMRNQAVTRDFYVNKLGFEQYGGDFLGYLMVQKDNIQIHFFEFKELDPKENYGQVYIRTNDIAALYRSFQENQVNIHPNGNLQTKPWGQKEFSILDPDNNLLTFGQSL
jgi:catechol 2,3-dioxygenase-like lactoylglutathione lyase family enzyme